MVNGIDTGVAAKMPLMQFKSHIGCLSLQFNSDLDNSTLLNSYSDHLTKSLTHLRNISTELNNRLYLAQPELLQASGKVE